MAIRATEAAWRSLDGEGVELSPFRSRLGLEGRFCLSASELVALLPRPDLPVVGNARGVRGADLLGLGRSHAGTTVAVPVEPDQGRHLAVLGETGMGKSSLLVALAVRAAALGGLVLLDPLGETAQAVARELDGERTRLLWIAPGPGAPGLNALEGIHPGSIRDRVRSERRTSDLVHALRRVRSGRYEESAFWGPRLEEMLTRAVRAAAAFPGATLADAHTLLSTTGLTRQRTPPGAEEVVGELALRIRQRPDDADGARRLLHEVVRNPTLEQMICARTPTLSPRELIAPGRIVLISGRASVVGESTARYLLAVYLALLWSELLASDDPQKTFVFLDEAQWFAHESLSEMLRLARRRNVHVVLATQSIASLPESVQEAVWTNVADLVAFRGSPEEAREIARVAPSITPDVLLSLPRGEAVAMVGKGRSVQSIRTARIPCRSSAGDAPSLPRSPPIDPANVRGENAIGGFGFGASAGIPEPVEGEWRSLEEVLGFLRANACSSAPGRAVRVVVSDLQRRAPGRPDLIRQVGASLGRSGALMRRERTPEGTVWWIDSGRLDQIGPIDPEKGGLLLAPTEAGGDPRPSAGGANRESNSASGPGRPGGPPAAGMAPQPKPS